MKITGKIVVVGSTQQITDTFKKRELVIEHAENPQYPEFVKLEAMQDKVTILDNLNVGAEVSVDFNIKGRAHTNKDGVTKYYTTLVAWKIEVLSQPEGDDDLAF